MIDGANTTVLRCGDLSFTAHHMGQGPAVLCLHGFPDTPLTYRELLPALARAGYRGIAVTMRGYEPSSQPVNGDYSMAALAADVGGWMDTLGVAKAHVIGHDWGAAAGYAAAALLPGRVLTLTMMSVPHPVMFSAVGLRSWGQKRRSWYMAFFQLRGMSDYFVARNDWAFVKMLWRHWSPEWTPESAHITDVRAHFSRPGVIAAALGYYRTAFDRKGPRSLESYALFAKPVAAPTLGLTGARDGCIGADVFETCMPAKFFRRGVTVKRIAGAGHFFHLEKPDEVNALIIGHLAKVT